MFPPLSDSSDGFSYLELSWFPWDTLYLIIIYAFANDGLSLHYLFRKFKSLL